jgi:putative two-component system response regulator
MMAIADVYDALRSRRPYKEPMSHEKSLGIILKDTGTHFDPTLAGIMERCSKDFLDVSKTLGDD